MSRPASIQSRVCAAAMVLSLVLAGCATDRRAHDEPAAPPPEERTPEMEGHAAFLDGHLEADVLLNRAGFGRHADAGSGDESRSARGGGHGRGGGFHGGFAGGRGRHNRGGGEDASGFGDDTPAAHIRASNLPPVRLHLRLTNTTDAALVVEIPQFDSDLGNFVVQPETITVPPHATAEADPMTSRLGVPADQVPITMSVRVNGATEHQVVILRLKTPPPN